MMDKLSVPREIALDDSLANGRGMSNCELVGISGYCGLDCPVLLAGECETEDEMLELILYDTLEDKALALVEGE